MQTLIAVVRLIGRDVQRRTDEDERVVALKRAVAAADRPERSKLQIELDLLTAEVHAEKLGEVADEFDAVHSVERALRVGSVDRIIDPADLRPYLVEAIERGMRSELERLGRDA